MLLRLAKVDELQFLTCLEHKIWGSKTARFRNWKVGDYLAFIVDKAIAGLAEVSGEPFISNKRVWDDGIFPHRIPIKFVHVMLPDNRPPVSGKIRDAMMKAGGGRYGWIIYCQYPVGGKPAETIVTSIRSRRNDLAKFRAKVPQYQAHAKLHRESLEE